MYQENIQRNRGIGDVDMHLLLWCRNVCPPNLPVIEISRSLVQSLYQIMSHSGFSAIWYINGIRDNDTHELHEPQRLLPLVDQDIADAIMGPDL